MEIVKLKDVSLFVRNGASIKQDKECKKGIPITRIETLANDKFNRDRMGYANITDINEYINYILEDGDILYSHINGEKQLGRAIIYEKKENENIIHGMNLLCIRPLKNKVIPKYLEYSLKSQINKIYIHKNTKRAVNQASIPASKVLESPIILYPIEDQLKIIDELNLINKNIEKYKKEELYFDEIIKSQFIEMFGDPKDNPNGYEIKNISELFNVGSSKRVFESEWTVSGIPFYRAREIVKLSKDGYVDNDLFITEEMYENYKNKYGVPQEDDMMVTGVGTLGICYIVKKEDKFYFKDGNTLWFKNKGLCNVRFIKDQFNTEFVIEQIELNANASTVGTYTITNANNTKVLVPPIDLQNEYVRFCEQIDKSKLIMFVSE